MEQRFSLPLLQVLQVIEIFRSGSNKPLLVGAVDESTGERMECVLKPNGGERMGKEAMLREITAAFIAKTWGIHAAEPVLLKVTTELIAANMGQEWHQLLENSLDINYGSVYLRNYQTPAIVQILNQKEFEQAQLIFAFDLFIQNPDRRRHKPNFMSNGEQLVVFDHELAFSYTSLLFPPANPWQISIEDWIEDMFLYAVIKGKPLPERAIEDNLRKIDETFWQNLDQTLPKALKELEEYTKIKHFCTAVVDHADAFIQALQTIAV